MVVPFNETHMKTMLFAREARIISDISDIDVYQSLHISHTWHVLLQWQHTYTIHHKNDEVYLVG